jgi:HK97 gp10 family phage protein
VASDSFEVVGLDQLDARMTELGRQISGPGMERMVRAGAKVFEKEMVDRAPLLKPGTGGETSLPPHALKSGIGITVRKKGEVQATVSPRGKALKLVAYDLEYGHREINHGVVGDDVPPHPFVRPAFEAGLAPAEEAMIASLNEMVAEVDG